jgi:hemolysin-activating ACP:hemolysin acyltransferase
MATKTEKTTTKAAEAPETGQPDPEMVAKLGALRTRILSAFGQCALVMMSVPRYRHLSIADLNHLLLEPLVQDRVAIASSKAGDGAEGGALAGIAIWASVSDEVDKSIREQIGANVFPVRIKTKDWNSGKTVWLLDVIAPSRKLTTSVLANFRQVVKDGPVHIHPMVGRMMDQDALKKMGATRENAASQPADA